MTGWGELHLAAVWKGASQGLHPDQGGFLDRSVAPETPAVLDLALQETADCFLELHSCGAGPMFMVGFDYLPERMSVR